jgi:hypothetical protein
MPRPTKSWSVERSPFFGVTTLRGNTTKDQRYVNMMIERLENKDSGSARFFATKRPGSVLYTTPSPAAAGRGMYSWKGFLYYCVGNQIYKDGVALSVTLTTTTGLISWVETSGIAAVQRLAFNDGAFLYCIKTDDTVTKVTDVDYPLTGNTGMVEFFDGYTIVATTDGNIYNSDNEDPTSWSPTQTIQAQKYPDPLVGIARQNDVLLAFGQWTTEQFYDAGTPAPSSFMARLDQGTLQIGCASRDSIVHQESFIFWVGASKLGGYTVQKLDGISNLEKVSNDSVEKLLNLEGANINSCYAYPARLGGHFYYILTLIGANRTFVYDIEEERWSEWQSGSSGKFLGVATEEHLNSPLWQDGATGVIYRFDPNTYQDNGQDIICILQTHPIDRDTQHIKLCKRIELYGDIYISSCPVFIKYSDDNYKNFSIARQVDMQYRSMLTSLGSYRRRAWRFEHSSNTPLRIEGFEEEFQEGTF